MLLKNVYQWDICNQEDLDIFTTESLEIDQSAARTLYRTDPTADPNQSRKRAEERAENNGTRRRMRRRRKPNETPEQLQKQGQKQAEKGKKKMPPAPVKEEPEEQLEEESEEEWTSIICTRDEFLERLARDLELRNGRESGRNDGYSIIVRGRRGAPGRECRPGRVRGDGRAKTRAPGRPQQRTHPGMVR